MNIHFKNALNLMKTAVLPDKAMSGLVGAALDGTGKTNKLTATVKGLGEDAFEVVKNPPLALIEVYKGLR